MRSFYRGVVSVCHNAVCDGALILIMELSVAVFTFDTENNLLQYKYVVSADDYWWMTSAG
eukprot:1241222-Karenia_brevis.AAC.1